MPAHSKITPNLDFAYWNYRIVKRVCDSLGVKEDVYAIHEVYYNNKSKPVAVTTNPCHIQGETVEDLKDDLKFYRQAFDKPVLNFEDIK